MVPVYIIGAGISILLLCAIFKTIADTRQVDRRNGDAE